MRKYKIIAFGLTLIAISLSLPGADPLRTMIAAAIGALAVVMVKIFR